MQHEDYNAVGPPVDMIEQLEGMFRDNGGDLHDSNSVLAGSTILMANSAADPRLIFIRDTTSRIAQCSVNSLCLSDRCIFT